MNAPSLIPKTPKQNGALTGIYGTALLAVINTDDLSWQKALAIVALCIAGHVITTKSNR